ncbi:MAG: DUF4856 domain-containing protein [Myxococcales bacterium]|nr:MAG: DUF4856 domain-containing protein [Myxococcales bacterium]
MVAGLYTRAYIENDIQLQKRARLVRALGLAFLTCFFLVFSACEDSNASEPGPTDYTFLARDSELSSVSYSGQILRHVLIEELNDYIAGLTARIDSSQLQPAEGDIAQDLNFYYRFDSEVGGQVDLTLPSELPLVQQSYDDVASGKNLHEKLAGVDATGQHKDWSTSFAGFEHEDVRSPESLVDFLFDQLDALAVARSHGDVGMAPDGSPLQVLHVTEEGWDIKELIEEFMLGAVIFSQATDDYLDSDLEDHGLNASHDMLEEGENATVLEHHWDEAFGYFGAARDYLEYSVDEIVTPGYRDSNGDGEVDLQSEYNFAFSVKAAQRDRDSIVPTDFTGDIFRAFRDGRTLLASVDGALSDAEHASLLGYRDVIVSTWEKVIAATLIHCINETLADTVALGSEAYDFYDHAEHFSEMKGFALALQFSPFSPLSDAQFNALHEKIGLYPVLAQGDAAGYQAALLEARALLAEVYAFDEGNLGNDQGKSGW